MDNDFILVLDLGGPEAIEMARKLRNQRYYTEIMSRAANIELFRRKSPRGILVVGGEGSPAAFPTPALALDVPVLALGNAARRMIEACGAVSEGILLQNQASQITFLPCPLFDQLSESDRYFTRVDAFTLPEGFQSIATTLEGYSPAFANVERKLYGLQFYAESNDPDGGVILSNFAEKICGCTPIWTMEDYIEEEIRFIRERVGTSRVLMAVSGGVDSAVCALLMRKALGSRMECVFIDHGLLRAGEAERVTNLFEYDLGLTLIHVDARERFLNCLKGLEDPVEKHRAVYNEYIAVMDETAATRPGTEFLAQGTIYSDLLVGGSSDEVYARRFDGGRCLEPIRMLFKDEVRRLAERMGLPQELMNRQPFPMPGLAIRCMGEVNAQRLDALRRADAIFREEIAAAGQEKRLSQYFAVLGESRTLGRRADAYVRGYVCALRAVTEQGVTAFSVGKLPYDLLDRVAARIIGEIPIITRVTYDISPSENADIEWE